MSLLSEYNDILTDQQKAMGGIATALRSDLVKITPVDSGFLRSSWIDVEPTKDGYTFSNTALYADVALHERRVVRGKMYGSLQNVEGIDPTIKYYEKELQMELNKI